MASIKPFNLPPPTVIVYTILAVAASVVWLTAFAIQIFNTHNKAPNPPPHHHRGFLLPAALFTVYLIHFAVALCLPTCSRPWLWKTECKRSLNFLEIFMIAMGWDNYDREHWAIGGTRGVVSFVVSLAPFLLPIEKSAWGFAAIVALAVESFFFSETVKHTEMEEGVFYVMMSAAVSAVRRVFGYSSPELFIMLGLCLLLIFFHSLLPFYDADEFVFVEPPPDSYDSATASRPAPAGGGAV